VTLSANSNFVFQEYYLEQEIVDTYTKVVERLLVALAEETDEDSKQRRPSSPALVNNADPEVWPPWPWPPWGDEKDPEKKKPKNKTLGISKLAKAVVEFEAKLANASLDL